VTTLTRQQRLAAESRPAIDRALGLIDGISLRPDRQEFGGATVPPHWFNRAVLLDDDLTDVQTGDDVYCGPEVFHLWPVSGRVVKVGTADAAAVMHSVSSVSVKHVRGRVRRCMPKMLLSSYAYVDEAGKGRTSQHVFGVNPDGSLVNITNNAGRPNRSGMDVLDIQARMAAGIGLYLRYSWTVEIRAVGSNFTISIPTSPEGARQLLSLRDVESGMQRRRALRHWVSGHSRRRSREDVTKDVDVRSHLRGVTPFQWEDLEGVVRPSAYDLEQMAVSK